MQTDRPIPPTEEIVAVVRERQVTAAQHEDWPGYDQLGRITSNLDRGATLVWQLGDLLITSVNTPGKEYTVNRAGCTCPNGRAGRAHCWHVALYDLLLDMQAEAADEADDAADATVIRLELGARLVAARQRLIEPAPASDPTDSSVRKAASERGPGRRGPDIAPDDDDGYALAFAALLAAA